MARDERCPPAKDSATLDFQAQLWKMADEMRGHMDAAEYKHVALGLIFLKYISDAFEARREALLAEGWDAEDRDEYVAEGIFWVPPEARWEMIRAAAPQPKMGKTIDDAMEAIERENPSLRGVLPKGYQREGMATVGLVELVNRVSDVGLRRSHREQQDVLGRVYEYS